MNQDQRTKTHGTKISWSYLDVGKSVIFWDIKFLHNLLHTTHLWINRDNYLVTTVPYNILSIVSLLMSTSSFLFMESVAQLDLLHVSS